MPALGGRDYLIKPRMSWALRRCPFCGSDNVRSECEAVDVGFGSFARGVHCHDCHALAIWMDGRQWDKRAALV